MSEMPLEEMPDLTNVAYRAAEGGQVVHLTEHGRRLAAVLSAEAYEDYRRLQQEEITRTIKERIADDSPRRTFTSVEDMMREAGLT